VSSVDEPHGPCPASPGIPIYLRKGRERRLRFGHPWIFSNEIDIARSPLKGLPPGELVQVRNHRELAQGIGYVNPGSLIAVRLFGREPGLRVDRAMLTERLTRADALRARALAAPFYRMVYGESDGLPGLVVDRYGDVFVAQITTAGMERLSGLVVDTLASAFSPRCIFLKNDSPARRLEQLAQYTEVVCGELPDIILYEEHGARFEISPAGGQKTGWFFDHRANRGRLARHVRVLGAGREQGPRVLDLFSYTGAWGVQCATAGAEEVICVESSARAVEHTVRHAELNGVGERVQAVRSDVFDFLRQARSEGQRFDVVVADPPAFIRRKKDFESGLEAYRRLNGLALQVLAPGGMMVSASCSHHLEPGKLREIIARVASGVRRHVVIVGQGHQDIDHPVLPGLPESDYLKAFFLQSCETA